MERDALRMRGEGPFLFTQVKNEQGVDEVVSHVIAAWENARRHGEGKQESRRTGE
jgi:urease accessory protein